MARSVSVGSLPNRSVTRDHKVLVQTAAGTGLVTLEDAVTAVGAVSSIIDDGSPITPYQSSVPEAIGEMFSGMGKSETPPVGGFFKDDDPTTKIFRFRDRVFFGAAAAHNGRRTAPLGSTWLTQYGANYLEKNSQVIALADQRYALLVGGYTPLGSAPVANGGLMAVTVNRGTGSFGRAIYAEAFHQGAANATDCIECVVGNYTSTAPATATPYGVGGGAKGITITASIDPNYVVGDSSTPIATPTHGSNVALVIGGGGAHNPTQQFKTGLVFLQNSLFRGSDGYTGTAPAIKMAAGHEVQWHASASIMGATIRSDVTALSGQDVSIVFQNNKVSVNGTGEVPIATFSRDTVGAGPVNYLDLKNARTTFPVILQATGSDTDVHFFGQTKGAGTFRFKSADGVDEQVRISATASAVNFVNLTGAVTGSGVSIGALGSDTDIDVRLVPKGAGRVRIGTRVSTSDVAITGYIEIKDAGGTIRKLAIID